MIGFCKDLWELNKKSLEFQKKHWFGMIIYYAIVVLICFPTLFPWDYIKYQLFEKPRKEKKKK